MLIETLVVWTCFCILQTGAQSALTVNCGAREEVIQGSIHTISCEGVSSGDDVTWRFVPDSDVNPVTVGTCTTNSVCSSLNPELYELSRDGGRSEVRVMRVERDGKTVLGEWRCQQSGKSHACKSSKVIWPPEVNRNLCTISFDEYHHEVNADCHVVKGFPEATCHWLYNIVGYNPQDVPSSYTKMSRREYSDASGEVFYETLCTIDKMTLPKVEGIYEFRVIINPGNIKPSVVFNGTNIIAKPNTPRLMGCKADYIDLPRTPADTRICTCTTNTMGSPPGLLQWVGPDGIHVVLEKSSMIDLLLKQVDVNYSYRTFTCIVQHHTGAVNVSYTPKLAYGPRSVVISNDSDPGSEYHTFSCTVREVNPQPEVTFRWEGDIVLQQAGQTQKEGARSYVNTIVFKVKRDTSVTCTAKNPHRPNSQISDTKLVKVAGVSSAASPRQLTSSLRVTWLLASVLCVTTVNS